MKPQHKLIIDARERNVLRHQVELAEINYEIAQITTSDYAIIDSHDHICVAIERKSLEDFAASIKDGRSDNINKMIRLREKTGCVLLYIIEGKAFPSPTETFGRIPYLAIESSIFHLMLRDNVAFIYTANTLETAKMLVRLMRSIGTLRGGITGVIGGNEVVTVATNNTVPAITTDNTNNNNNNNNNNNVPMPPTIETSSIKLLTEVHKKTDHEVRRSMWSCFRGISTESADEFIAKWTLYEIVCDKIPRDQITGAKTAGGRKISKRVIASLTGIDKAAETRLLGCIEGISAKTASELMSERSLSALLNYGVEGISMCKVGKLKKCLGRERAERILRLFGVPGV